MKVLHIIPSMNPKFGGPSQGIRNYEYGLRGKNVERHIVCFDNIEDVKSWDNSTLIIHPLGESKNVWKYNKKFATWLTTNVENYDAIIINGLWLYHSYKTIQIINSLKKQEITTPKVFIMPHGMLDPWFQKSPTRRLKALRNEIYWRIIEKQVINSADAILFTCAEELELAKQAFKGYNPKKTVNVGYGIAEPPIYTPLMDIALKKEWTKFYEKNYWLFLSRINVKKGIDILIEAYKHLLLEVHSDDVPDLVIIGPGIESDFGQSVLSLVNESISLQKKIHFVGMLKGDAKWGALYNCEAFILPSHQENFGIVIAEALACAKPVLISNKVNIWHEIKQSGSGLICEDNSSSILNMLKEFYDLNKEEKKAMSINARSAFETLFEVSKTADQLINAIK